MKNILLLIFLFFLYFNHLLAQENTSLGKAKFELIKKAVWFYSKDTKTFTNKPSDCSKSQSYKELKECANSMGGVSAKVTEWEGIKIGSVEDLRFLNDRIFKALLKKENRKELPEYKTFLTQSNKIISDIEDQSVDDFSSSQRDSVSNSSTIGGINQEPIHNEQNIANSKNMNLKEVNDNADSGINIWLILTITLAIGGFIYTWITNKTLKEGIKDLNNRINNIGAENSNSLKIAQRVSAIEQEMKSFDRNFEELRQSIKKNQNLNTNNETSSQQIQVPQIKTSNVTNQSNNITKYAKYADLGDGFSANELLDSPDDDTIFEIQIISNNSALLRIISNNNAQRYALTNPSYFFSKTCEYDSVPSANSKIVTSSDGDLKLQSGKWQITNPAKISFE